MSQKQAKRRRQEQKARERQETLNRGLHPNNEKQQEDIRDLEELLKSGNIDGYAQACWSLANRGEEPPASRTHHNLIRSMRGT